ncbi:hypothetical protein CLI75_11870, partial [Porphyromonas gingivalis]
PLRQRAFPVILTCYSLYGYPLEEYPDWYDLLFHNLLGYYFLVADRSLWPESEQASFAGVRPVRRPADCPQDKR